MHVSNHCKVAIEEIIIGNNIFVFLFYTLAHSGTFQTLLHEPIHYHYYLFDCKREKSQQSLSLRTCNLLSKYYRRNVIVLKQKINSELFYHQQLVQNNLLENVYGRVDIFDFTCDGKNDVLSPYRWLVQNDPSVGVIGYLGKGH